MPALMAASGNPPPDDDQPTIAKDSIRVTIQNNAGGDAASQTSAWLPGIDFRVNGPIASGSQLYVSFSLPTKKNWIDADCDTSEIKKGEWWQTSCGGSAIAKSKAVFYSGPMDFSIHIRNELLGLNATLFTGKAKVMKVVAYAGSKDFDYWVDEDWNIPIGYVYFAGDSGHGVTSLNVAFWYRGNPPDVQAHLFYKGKDIAKYSSAGNGAGDWDPSKHQWGFEQCSFLGVYRTQQEAEDGYDPKFSIEKNPGDYEVKVLIVNHLARSIKFSVGADGKIVDNGIATANKLGTNRILVPVQVIGNQGPWDKLAWKTGAFYGNPLTGFTPAP
jgi:hypothetical protein